MCLNLADGFSHAEMGSSTVLKTQNKVFVWTEEEIENALFVRKTRETYRFALVYWYIDERAKSQTLLKSCSAQAPYPVPEMVCRLDSITSITLNPDITIKRVENENDLSIWCEIASQGRIQKQVDQTRAFASPLLKQCGDDCMLYLGYFKGKPLSTSLVILDGDIVGLFFVNTHIEARRLGLGEAVSYTALMDARRRGALTAILTSTAMAEKLYKKLGFTIKRTFLEYNLSAYIRQV